MLGIPLAKDTDAEDVAWGLQTAEALWKRGERIDAIVWLRRAAQAAGEGTDDDRALELARSAAELTDWMASSASSRPVEVDVDEDTEIGRPSFAPTTTRDAPPAVVAGRPLPPRSRAPSQATIETPDPSSRDSRAAEPVASLDARSLVPPADKVHAGMFNPWATTPDRDDRVPVSAPPPVPSRAPPGDNRSLFPEDDEIVTSVQPPRNAQKRADALATSLAPPRPSPPSPDAWAALPAEPPLPSPAVPPRPPPLPPRGVKPRSPSASTLPLMAAPAEAPARMTPVPPSPTQVMPNAPRRPLPPPSVPDDEPTAVVHPGLSNPQSSDDDPPTVQGQEPAPRVANDEPLPAHAAPLSDLALEDVEAFSDLPDDARTAFASAAHVSTLAEGDEVSAFALAYIVSGTVDVAATMVDAPAARLEGGAVLRARGTTADGVPMRLIGVKSGIVATWSDAAVQDAFRTCPWVEEDLRVAADRLQTLVGVTIGPLGERLDASIREQIIARLTMRTLLPGEVVVTAGEQMPGLLLIGVGQLELVDGDRVVGSVGSGEFLFPTEVLGAGKAPNTARAGASGALILFGDRMIAQELLVTCPPLLEVFAGM